ncbi:MAG TPA: hypothetical protein VGF77_03695 [Allosphingosinicella sp.]
MDISSAIGREGMDEEALGRLVDGGPLKHEPARKPALFERWLGLETADQELSPEGAAAVHAKAERIAESLQLGLSFARGEHETAPRAGRQAQAAPGGPNG